MTLFKDQQYVLIGKFAVLPVDVSALKALCLFMPTGRKCLRLDAQDMDEIEKIGGD